MSRFHQRLESQRSFARGLFPFLAALLLTVHAPAVRPGDLVEIFSDGFEFGTAHGWDRSFPACDGVFYQGACWYLGAPNESCSSTCELRGGNHQATRDVTGSFGTPAACGEVLQALGRSNWSSILEVPDVDGAESLGCGVVPNGGGDDAYWVTTETSWEASSGDVPAAFEGVCACGAQPAPVSISYPDSPGDFFREVPSPSFVPDFTGIPLTWMIQPELPSGLVLDPATGILSGTATQVLATTDFTVRGANSGGGVQTVLTLTVSAPEPLDLSYPGAWT